MLPLVPIIFMVAFWTPVIIVSTPVILAMDFTRLLTISPSTILADMAHLVDSVVNYSPSNQAAPQSWSGWPYIVYIPPPPPPTALTTVIASRELASYSPRSQPTIGPPVSSLESAGALFLILWTVFIALCFCAFLLLPTMFRGPATLPQAPGLLAGSSLLAEDFTFNNVEEFIHVQNTAMPQAWTLDPSVTHTATMFDSHRGELSGGSPVANAAPLLPTMPVETDLDSLPLVAVFDLSLSDTRDFTIVTPDQYEDDKKDRPASLAMELVSLPHGSAAVGLAAMADVQGSELSDQGHDGTGDVTSSIISEETPASQSIPSPVDQPLVSPMFTNIDIVPQTTLDTACPGEQLVDTMDERGVYSYKFSPNAFQESSDKMDAFSISEVDNQGADHVGADDVSSDNGVSESFVHGLRHADEEYLHMPVLPLSISNSLPDAHSHKALVITSRVDQQETDVDNGIAPWTPSSSQSPDQECDEVASVYSNSGLIEAGSASFVRTPLSSADEAVLDPKVVLSRISIVEPADTVDIASVQEEHVQDLTDTFEWLFSKTDNPKGAFPGSSFSSDDPSAEPGELVDPEPLPYTDNVSESLSGAGVLVPLSAGPVDINESATCHSDLAPGLVHTHGNLAIVLVSPVTDSVDTVNEHGAQVGDSSPDSVGISEELTDEDDRRSSLDVVHDSEDVDCDCSASNNTVAMTLSGHVPVDVDEGVPVEALTISLLPPRAGVHINDDAVPSSSSADVFGEANTADINPKESLIRQPIHHFPTPDLEQAKELLPLVPPSEANSSFAPTRHDPSVDTISPSVFPFHPYNKSTRQMRKKVKAPRWARNSKSADVLSSVTITNVPDRDPLLHGQDQRDPFTFYPSILGSAAFPLLPAEARMLDAPVQPESEEQDLKDSTCAFDTPAFLPKNISTPASSSSGDSPDGPLTPEQNSIADSCIRSFPDTPSYPEDIASTERLSSTSLPLGKWRDLSSIHPTLETRSSPEAYSAAIHPPLQFLSQNEDQSTQHNFGLDGNKLTTPPSPDAPISSGQDAPTTTAPTYVSDAAVPSEIACVPPSVLTFDEGSSPPCPATPILPGVYDPPGGVSFGLQDSGGNDVFETSAHPHLSLATTQETLCLTDANDSSVLSRDSVLNNAPALQASALIYADTRKALDPFGGAKLSEEQLARILNAVSSNATPAIESCYGHQSDGVGGHSQAAMVFRSTQEAVAAPLHAQDIPMEISKPDVRRGAGDNSSNRAFAPDVPLDDAKLLLSFSVDAKERRPKNTAASMDVDEAPSPSNNSVAPLSSGLNFKMPHTVTPGHVAEGPAVGFGYQLGSSSGLSARHHDAEATYSPGRDQWTKEGEVEMNVDGFAEQLVMAPQHSHNQAYEAAMASNRTARILSTAHTNTSCGAPPNPDVKPFVQLGGSAGSFPSSSGSNTHASYDGTHNLWGSSYQESSERSSLEVTSSFPPSGYNFGRGFEFGLSSSSSCNRASINPVADPNFSLDALRPTISSQPSMFGFQHLGEASRLDSNDSSERDWTDEESAFLEQMLDEVAPEKINTVPTTLPPELLPGYVFPTSTPGPPSSLAPVPAASPLPIFTHDDTSCSNNAGPTGDPSIPIEERPIKGLPSRRRRTQISSPIALGEPTTARTPASPVRLVPMSSDTGTSTSPPISPEVTFAPLLPGLPPVQTNNLGPDIDFWRSPSNPRTPELFGAEEPEHLTSFIPRK